MTENFLVCSACYGPYAPSTGFMVQVTEALSVAASKGDSAFGPRDNQRVSPLCAPFRQLCMWKVAGGCVSICAELRTGSKMNVGSWTCLFPQSLPTRLPHHTHFNPPEQGDAGGTATSHFHGRDFKAAERTAGASCGNVSARWELTCLELVLWLLGVHVLYTLQRKDALNRGTEFPWCYPAGWGPSGGWARNGPLSWAVLESHRALSILEEMALPSLLKGKPEFRGNLNTLKLERSLENQTQLTVTDQNMKQRSSVANNEFSNPEICLSSWPSPSPHNYPLRKRPSVSHTKEHSKSGKT